MRYHIFPILLVVPLLLTAQSKKEQIYTLNLRVDSISEVLVNERLNSSQSLSDKSDKIFQLSQEIVSMNKTIELYFQQSLNYQEQSLNYQDTITELHAALSNFLYPYKLSKGIIDHRLFTFINSDNIDKDGFIDLQKMIKINNIKIDSITVGGLNDPGGGCGCCDGSAFWNEGIFYFKEGKVLIVEKHYDGDWESSSADWYDCYLYNANEKEFKLALTLRATDDFAYNYNTNYIVVSESAICDYEGELIILNNKLEQVGSFYWGDGSPNFYWNEERNEIIIEDYDRESSMRYDNINNEWIDN